MATITEMPKETKNELRRTDRTDMNWPVSLWLPEANRFINARSINISKGGAFISIPANTPIRSGNIVEINFPRTTSLAQEKGQFARIKGGKVLRVDRGNLLKDATMAVAVEFV